MKNFKTVLDIILKEFQEGVDFTVESKEKIIFHNEEIVNCFTKQLQVEEFFKAVKRLIPSVLCSYEESGSGWSRRCTFAFKSGNNKKDRKQEIEKNLKENTGIDITYHGENQGRRVISRKFENPEIEKQKNELIEEDMKGDKKQTDKSGEVLNRHFVDSGDSLTYSIERKNKDGVVKESYIERNQKRREQELEEKKKDLEQQTQSQEKSQHETSPNPHKQEHQVEKEDNQQNQAQKNR